MEHTQSIKFQKLDVSHYAVSACGVVVGEVFRDDSAWSNGRWFIVGDRRECTRGGYSSGGPIKFRGSVSREAAAIRLAVMQSGFILSHLH